MGGGDLNQKKSWHPHTFKNQERVWKAEQNEAAEKRKLAELQKEISEERGREELRRIGQASGIIKQDDGHKLEWMYRGPKENLNREDYLLGRAVDKTFEQHAEEERTTENHLGVSVPKNHVEYECVPFSIRAYKDADPTSVQVDMVRKIAEDPLMMIKQREMESRKKLLENPVKLKELKLLLQSEKGGGKDKHKSKKKEKKPKKDKKAKKSKKRRKSKSESSESSESDVDDALLSMLSKQRGIVDEEVDMEDLDFQDVVNLKYDTLNKELDKMINKKQKPKKGSDNESGQDEDRNNRDRGRGGGGWGRDDEWNGKNQRRNDSRERMAMKQSDRGRRNNSPPSRRRDNRENDYERSSNNRREDRGTRDGDVSTRRDNHRDPRDRSRSPNRERNIRGKNDKRNRSKSPEKQKRIERTPSRDRFDLSSHGAKYNSKGDYKHRATSRHRSRSPQKSQRGEKPKSRHSHSRSPEKRARRKSATPERQRHRNRSPEERSRKKSPDHRQKKRSISRDKSSRNRSPEKRPLRPSPPPKNQSRHTPAGDDSSSSSESNTPPRQGRADDSDEERRTRGKPIQNYGLITASGESIALKNTGKSYTDRRTAASSSKDAANSSTGWKKPQSKAPLTAEEKAEKLREMMKNAEWRNEERETYVRKYYENDRREEEKSREFDRNFIHKELHKSAQSETVESRIKSNRNNIQRSSSSMNTNFARR